MSCVIHPTQHKKIPVDNRGWSDEGVGALFVVLSVVGLCVTLVLLVKLLKSVFQGRARVWVVKLLSFNPYVAMLLGMVLTVAVQSSSIVTSTLVPLVGISAVTLEQVSALVFVFSFREFVLILIS